ncbi:UNVERIFIED_CONTAM: hypothetical protein Sradi_5259900 [Sesamum radiatum]|uniref:Retrotransposon gag domain-containing protein n=1 Tax=Sesamum radiatum TaxID=300843 RepID=A0AAW2LLF1_SESRA
MPRSSRIGELQFNSKIEKIARRLRKETKQKRTRAALDVDLTVGGESIFEETEAKMAANNRRSIKELNTPNSDQQPFTFDFEDFFLKDKAKDWLYYLPSGSIETWVDMKQQFLQRFFPASRATHLRKEIYGIRQSNGESLYEYWERFKVLVASYPHHQFTESLLIQYFYEGSQGWIKAW